jgi:integrase
VTVAIEMDVLDGWLGWLELGDKRPRTITQYEADVRRLLDTFPARSLAELTSSDLQQVLLTWPVGSRRTKAEAFRSLFRWARAAGVVDVDPTEWLPTIAKPKQKVYDIFGEEELERLYAHEDAALLGLLVEAGLRKSEAICLLADDVDLVGRKVTVRDGKGGKDRVIPLFSRLHSRLKVSVRRLEPEDYLWYSKPGGGGHDHARPVSGSSFDRWWRRSLEEAGVRYRNAHLARHTYATRWLRRGGRLTTLSRAMGHSSLSTTSDLYGHLDETDIAADIATMEAA